MYIAQEGRFQLVNPRFQRLTGYTKDELLGMDSLSLVVPQDKNTVRKNAVRMLRGEHSSPYEFRCINKRGEIGWVMEKVTAIEYRGRPATLGNFMDITERKQAEEELKQSWEKLRRVLEETVDALASLVEKRDPYTAGHQQRVTKLACAIAQEIGLPEEQIDGIRVAGAIHDVGKMYVPTGILSKPGKLTDYEFAIIKTHPQVGYEIVKGIEFPWPVAQAILQHHERLDGSGYPAGLSGEESILEARILAVADVVEAMSSHRPFRPALGTDKALEEVSQNSGILYDPAVVDACLKLFNEKGFRFE
jgi:PAS domain S-box-containing protein/putative nucleotidyltransferase with HDIG domain